MTEFKIEKGIPMPPNAGRGRYKYPWVDMEIGESFFVPGKGARSFGGQVQNAHKKHPDRRFTTRSVDGGVRVWRVE